MCLIANEDNVLEPGQWLLLDGRSHPGFGQLRLRARQRWFSRAHFALSYGVAFVARPGEGAGLILPDRLDALSR
jgi:hypothetical protein